MLTMLNICQIHHNNTCNSPCTQSLLHKKPISSLSSLLVTLQMKCPPSWEFTPAPYPDFEGSIAPTSPHQLEPAQPSYLIEQSSMLSTSSPLERWKQL